MADVKISELPSASTITGAEEIPIVQSGDTVKSTVNAMKNGAIKVYRTLLTQVSTNAPVATVLENTLYGTPVWTRLGVGIYQIELTGAFTVDKTFVLSSGASGAVTPAYGGSADVYFIATFDLLANPVAYSDNVLSKSSLEVLVYP